MVHWIEVNDIRVYGQHGCLESEGIVGQSYRVDLKIKSDFTQATLTDELTHTIDYVVLNQIVVQEMKKRSKLIEHVGQRIWNRITQETSGCQYLSVKITKYNPPINGDVSDVAIIIEGENV